MSNIQRRRRDLIPIKNIFLVYLQLSHLYSMFAKQVKDYCKDKHNANASQCKRNMMVYGMDKLNDMEESHLDKMDPYQRDANNIRKYHMLCVVINLMGKVITFECVQSVNSISKFFQRNTCL